MADIQVERAPGGFQVEGQVLQRGKCGCGGMGGDCCFTFSKVKKDGNRLVYEGKATAPSTTDNFDWGYVVRKGDVEIQVDMQDTRDPHPFFAGHYPPSLQTWVDKGWEIVSQYEKPAAESSTDSD
jgi:hypothetical protein